MLFQVRQDEQGQCQLAFMPSFHGVNSQGIVLGDARRAPAPHEKRARLEAGGQGCKARAAKSESTTSIGGEIARTLQEGQTDPCKPQGRFALKSSVEP